MNGDNNKRDCDACKNADNKRLVVRLRNLVKNTSDVLWPSYIPKHRTSQNSEEREFQSQPVISMKELFDSTRAD